MAPGAHRHDARGSYARRSGGGTVLRAGTFVFAAAALSVVLSGCALIGGGSKPLDTYQLTAPATGTGDGGRGGRQILIAEPSALKDLDGQNIVIQPSPGVIQYLAGAQWADRLPRIIQAR